MSEFTRVLDKKSGHKYSVATSVAEANEETLEILDEDAIDPNGRPLPPEYAPPKELTSMSKDELVQLAEERGVDLSGAKNNEQRAAAIQAATPQEG